MCGHSPPSDAQGPGRRTGPTRWIQVVLRSIHIAAAGIVLGAAFLCSGDQSVEFAIGAAAVSGFALLALDLAKGLSFLRLGSGVAVLVKLALVAVGASHPEHRFAWYLAATMVASVGSHMPGSWRHYSFRRGRDTDAGSRHADPV
jgi:hypothetical protein